ncbi:MAG: MFS transporter [Deltaproteobacteria bacterium]|nr:MFS transporter [Deltaproteobacteria bacterium]
MALASLRHRDFRIFWTGQILSGFGTQFSTVAMAWQIYVLTDSPLHIGMLGLVRAIPQMALLLLGGLLADAVDRRRLLIVTQLGQFLVSAGLVVVTISGRASPFALYLATVFLAVFSSLETPARQALPPNLVPRPELANALALTNAQRHVAMIAGPSLAGLALGFVGPALCYGVDAVSWLAMAFSLVCIRTPLKGGGRRALSFTALAEGVRFVRSQRVILLFMSLDFGMTFFASTRALLPIFARDILQVGPEGLGILHSAVAVGSLGAAVTLSLLGGVRRAGRWVLTGVAIYGLCVLFFALSTSFWFSALMLAGTGIGNTIGAVLRHTINQLCTPDELRGRMSSVNSVFTNGGPQLGQFESGVVASFVGADIAAFIGGVVTLVLVAGLSFAAPVARRFEITGEEATAK